MGLFHSESDEGVEISVRAYALTRAGKELYSIVNECSNNDFFIDFLKEIVSCNRGNFSISIHLIDSINNGQINYQKMPIEVLKS